MKKHPEKKNILKEFMLARPRFFLGLGLALLGIAIFLSIAYSLFHHEQGGLAEHAIWNFDRQLMLKQLEVRTPKLNAMMIDVSALGSSFTLYYFSIFVVLLLCTLRNFKAALQFVLASYGANFLQSQLKDIFERPRPTEIMKLVEIGNFSFPSGHACASAAIYLSMALVGAHYLSSRSQRILLFSAAGILAALISYSRVYLGVHYPSDVMAGAALGMAWALIVMSVREYFFPHQTKIHNEKQRRK